VGLARGVIAGLACRSATTRSSANTLGAGSVVTTDLPANVVAVGNPARVVKEV